MTHNQVLAVTLFITLCAPACGGACESNSDTYASGDHLPRRAITVGEVLAASEIHLVEERTWIPDPSEYEGGAYGPTPPLPFEGSTQLEVEVTPLRDVLIDHYSDGYDCAANQSPEAPARITIRTSDGALNEEVVGTLRAPEGTPYITATITEPKGRIKEYFASYESPMVPKLSVEIRQTDVHLQFVLERRHKDGASYDYVTLF